MPANKYLHQEKNQQETERMCDNTVIQGSGTCCRLLQSHFLITTT